MENEKLGEEAERFSNNHYLRSIGAFEAFGPNLHRHRFPQPQQLKIHEDNVARNCVSHNFIVQTTYYSIVREIEKLPSCLRTH